MSRSKPKQYSGKYSKRNLFCGEENISSELASPASGKFYAKEQISAYPISTSPFLQHG